MAASKRYSDEFRRHALRMVGEIHDEGVDQADAIERVADLLSMPLRTLREWVDQAESQPEPESQTRAPNVRAPDGRRHRD